MPEMPGGDGQALGAGRMGPGHRERRRLPCVELVDDAPVDAAVRGHHVTQVVGQPHRYRDGGHRRLHLGLGSSGEMGAQVGGLHRSRSAPRHHRVPQLGEPFAQLDDLAVDGGISTHSVSAHHSDHPSTDDEPIEGLGHRVVVDRLDDRVHVGDPAQPAALDEDPVGVEVGGPLVAARVVSVEPAQQLVRRVQRRPERIDREIARFDVREHGRKGRGAARPTDSGSPGPGGEGSRPSRMSLAASARRPC